MPESKSSRTSAEKSAPHGVGGCGEQPFPDGRGSVQDRGSAQSRGSIRLCVAATVGISIQNLCRGRLEYLIGRGFEITVVCAPTPLAAEIEARGVRLHTAPLTRSLTPLRDIAALWNLWRFFRRERFDIVEVSTPKAALLGSIAARMAGVLCIVHILRGLSYQAQRSPMLRILRSATAIPCRLAHHTISISESMRQQAQLDGVCTLERSLVLGQGSSNGVDLNRFRPGEEEIRRKLRDEHNIAQDAIVIGFVGRMTVDKGLVELVDAFSGLPDKSDQIYLLFVGAYEQRDRPPARIVAAIADNVRIRHVGWQRDSAPFYAATDICVLPSHREGFGAVLLEAAASGLPVIATDIVGCRDAFDDGVTGIRVAPHDTDGLRDAIATLASDANLRRRMGRAGRKWVEDNFEQTKIWALYEQLYRQWTQRYTETNRDRAASA